MRAPRYGWGDCSKGYVTHDEGTQAGRGAPTGPPPAQNHLGDAEQQDTTFAVGAGFGARPTLSQPNEGYREGNYPSLSLHCGLSPARKVPCFVATRRDHSCRGVQHLRNPEASESFLQACPRAGGAYSG